MQDIKFFLTVFGNVTNKKEEIMKRKLLTGILATTLLAGLATEASAGLFKKKAKTSNESQEIVVWEQMEPTGLEVFTEIVNDFMAQNPNIKVTVTHYPNEDLRTNFQNASLAGQGPDIVYGPNDNIGLFIVSDLIKPVDEVVSSDFLSTIEKNSLDAGKINGKYYQIPDMNGNQIALLYNKALVKEAPKTWDEFYEIAKKYQKVDELDPENSTYGFLYNEKEPYWFVGWYQGYGGRVMDENYNPTLNNEAMVKALQFAYDVRNKYGLGEAGMDYDMSSQLFKQGKAAFLLNGAWSWQEYVNAGIDLGIAPMTTLPNGGGNATFYSATKGFSISSSVEEDKYEAISKFFEFVLSPENNAKYAKAQSQAPAVLAARELPEIKNDALQRASIATIEKTTPMPIVAEMRAIWDAMRPTLEAVINGSLTPAEAAAKMQEDAEYGIRTIRGE
jgi:maltose-binding protein MalE